jgi:hypothetical protein
MDKKEISKIIKRKIQYYGFTDAACDFAADEIYNQLTEGESKKCDHNNSIPFDYKSRHCLDCNELINN